MSRQQLQDIFTTLTAFIQTSFPRHGLRRAVRSLPSLSPGPRPRPSSTSESLDFDMDEFQNINNNTPVEYKTDFFEGRINVYKTEKNKKIANEGIP